METSKPTESQSQESKPFTVVEELFQQGSADSKSLKVIKLVDCLSDWELKIFDELSQNLFAKRISNKEPADFASPYSLENLKPSEHFMMISDEAMNLALHFILHRRKVLTVKKELKS